MKKNSITPIVAIMLAVATLCSSCTKEEYNLDNISDEIIFQTSLAAPLIESRKINLIDMFDMEFSNESRFYLDEQQANHVKEKLGANTNCLTEIENDKYALELSKMNGLDMEKIGELGVSVDPSQLPQYTDFIEIDDLDQVFGDGNAINEINEADLVMNVDNKTNFIISISIAFATDREDTQCIMAETDKADNTIEIQPGESGAKNLTFRSLKEKMKDKKGMLIAFAITTDNSDSFSISVDQYLSMDLKAFVDATIDLSNID